MDDAKKPSLREEIQAKEEKILHDLDLSERGLLEDRLDEDAAVIANAIAHIHLLSSDLKKCAEANETFAVTNKALMGELSNKEKNLLSFHSANILQGLINRGVDKTIGDEDLINRSIELANKIIDGISNEVAKDKD